MSTPTHFKIFIALGVFLVGSAMQAHAQTDISQITFPIPQLGNCADREACHVYCDAPGHILVCSSFGEQHALISHQEAQRAQIFAKTLKAGGGPGQCGSAQECRAYCADPANATTCIKFIQTINPQITVSPKLKKASIEFGQTHASDLDETPPTPMPIPSSVIPPELLNGGGTNLPAPAPAKVHSFNFQGSLLGLIRQFIH